LSACVFRAKGAAGVEMFPQFCETEYKTEFLNYPPLADWGGGGGPNLNQDSFENKFGVCPVVPAIKYVPIFPRLRRGSPN